VSVSQKRRIAVVSTSRADFSILQPVLAELSKSEVLDYGLIAGGSHMLNEQGLTIEQVRKSGHPILAEAGMPFHSGPLGVARMMAAALATFAEAFGRTEPDIVLTLGDRFEMHAAVAAASPLGLPVAHIHGGEESEGAVDNMYRHSMTKLAHLHFCSTELSRKRILAMGEDPAQVHVTGAPALDGVSALPLLSQAELGERFGFPQEPYLLATYHPETLKASGGSEDFEAVLGAIEASGMATVFSRANADAAGDVINRRLDAAISSNPKLRIGDNLGRIGYFSAMARATAMVGNSSSGVIEAAAFRLPVVNVGGRQEGRERSGNIIDVAPDQHAILAAIREALSPAMRESLSTLVNIYDAGGASPIIRRVLETVEIGPSLLRKKFWLR
jgi:UDP-hydrolysing UDP-N-acetyl-D-glucosamine 2-epimerase